MEQVAETKFAEVDKKMIEAAIREKGRCWTQMQKEWFPHLTSKWLQNHISRNPELDQLSRIVHAQKREEIKKAFDSNLSEKKKTEKEQPVVIEVRGMNTYFSAKLMLII